MSDFSSALLHLRMAFDYLHGQDKISINSREAIDLLIEALDNAEYSRRGNNIIFHPALQKTRENL